jgi:hypothetical protein
VTEKMNYTPCKVTEKDLVPTLRIITLGKTKSTMEAGMPKGVRYLKESVYHVIDHAENLRRTCKLSRVPSTTKGSHVSLISESQHTRIYPDL